MKTRSSAAMLQLVAVSLLLLVTGCQTVEDYSLTYRVWGSANWRKLSEPAPNPNLALFEARNAADVLVQYDARSEQRTTVQRRAYYLYPNLARVAAETEPKWVEPSAAAGMKPITVLPTRDALTNLPPDLPAYAVVTRAGRGFTLYRAREEEAAYVLPVYTETLSTPTRIVLTPFAVAGDTVMVGAVAAVVGFLMWVHGGGSYP